MNFSGKCSVGKTFQFFFIILFHRESRLDWETILGPLQIRDTCAHDRLESIFSETDYDIDTRANNRYTIAP